MKKVFVFLFAATVLFTSCSDYGTKVAINDKSEVCYKGDGVSEADAKKLGSFLLEKNIFDTEDEKAVQLTKDSGAYVVRFVVDQDAYEKEKEMINSTFRLMQAWISERVFAGAKTKVVVADNSFQDLAQVGEVTTQEKNTAEILNLADSISVKMKADSNKTASESTK